MPKQISISEKRTPWKTEDNRIVNSDHLPVLLIPYIAIRSDEQAEIIKKTVLNAVNNHDELVRTLRDLVKAVEEDRQYGMAKLCNSANQLLSKLEETK